MERLPDEVEQLIQKKLYYGHFFCHVFHQDYIVKKGIDWLETEYKFLELLDRRNARYPAEHNFGHLYKAEDAVVAHYRELDSCKLQPWYWPDLETVALVLNGRSDSGRLCRRNRASLFGGDDLKCL